MKPPNLLVVLSDQHGGPFVGAAGHPVVRTPVMDRLAGEGVTFDRAYCHSPLCVPSRSALVTGKALQRLGVWDNGVVLPSEERTIGHRLSEAGYEAVLSGRMHFNGADKTHGFDRQIADDPDANRTIPDWEAGGKVVGHPFTSLPAEPGEGIAKDDAAEAAAIEFLEQRRDGANPWAMIVGFCHPHRPWNAEQRYWDKYPLEEIDLPRVGPPEVDGHPIHARNRRLREMPDEGFAEADIRRARAGYYACIWRIDDKLGRILDTLETTGQRENTIVVYTSDHGEMLGDHGLWMKSAFFENSLRVPMIVSMPGRFDAGRRIARNVSLLDLAATLCDAGGADTADMDGRSLRPMLEGEPDAEDNWPDDVRVEYYATWTDRPVGVYYRGEFKLIHAMNNPPQLFNLRHDPSETHDLAQDPDHAATLQSMLNALLVDWPVEQLNQQVRRSQRARMESRVVD